MKEEKLNIYADGAIVRLKNKRIGFHEKDGSFMLKFSVATEDAHFPGTINNCHRGKVRETYVKLSEKAMEVLVYAYLKYKQSKV